jgi:hypothetical protein
MSVLSKTKMMIYVCDVICLTEVMRVKGKKKGKSVRGNKTAANRRAAWTTTLANVVSLAHVLRPKSCIKEKGKVGYPPHIRLSISTSEGVVERPFSLGCPSGPCSEENNPAFAPGR